ncbi:parallel beta helix pectate lyase-like protein [Jejuia pallidilutea]|uniref:Parallel beta helix pectate lyase-like protein n=1 Tax=Jejuia pallidilutea TaxID=504487 RepID=A0A362XGT1_9FLAO|nr:right-handed parallel beta-helix repeat-containing protein [Jejuia pallidilutea]PQV51512.1 parallel beta helix pectate lyase-like protein [Jejuia pallidilutea]
MQFKNRSFFYIAFVFLSISTINAQENLKFYVSNSGKDSWSGSKEKPFKSLNKAKEAVLKKSNPKDNVTIFLREGTYFIDDALTFNSENWKYHEGTLTIKGFNDEVPRLSGGKKITNWTADKNGIYKASVKGLNFRQLYVNNKRAVRSRQPNVDDYNNLTGWDLKSRQLVMKSDLVEKWNNFEQVEAVIQMFWSEAIVQLKSFENFNGGARLAYVSIDDKQSDILFPRPFPPKQDNAVFHFENAYEFIDQPGEWYLNTKTETLYYMPEANEKMEALVVVAPVTETLIDIKGSLDYPINNISFENLVFEHANWNLPSTNGFINAQAGMYNLTAREDNYQTVRRPSAAIKVENAENIQFKGNLIQHMGSTGIDFISGTKKCIIEGNVIRSIAGNGTMIGAFTAEEDGEYHVPYNPSDLREVSTSDVVSNNYIYNVGCDYYGTSPISAGYTAEIKITHNTIEDAPYCGISLGYGWTDKPNAMHDNIIANNYISNVMNLVCDGAGIYTLSKQPGALISENYITNIKRSEEAGIYPIAYIYLDEKSGGTLERPMVVERNSLPKSDKTVQTWNFHREGIFLMDSNSVYDIPEIKDNAGYQESYKNQIEKMLKL